MISEKKKNLIRVEDVRLVLMDSLRVDKIIVLSDTLAVILAKKLKKVSKFLEGLDDD